MKHALTGVRSLRNTHPSSRDLPVTISFPLALTPSPIATSSRVRLPSRHLIAFPFPASHHRFCNSSALRNPTISPKVDGDLIRYRVSATLHTHDVRIAKRSLHSSASIHAQALEREYEVYDDPDSNWRDFAPFTAEETAGFMDKPSLRQVQIGSTRRLNKEVAVYEPTEADFGVPDLGSSTGEDVSWADEHVPNLSEEDVRQGMDVWEEATVKKPKRRTRKMRLQMPDLPPLQPGEVLGVEEERYDWRKTALSQTKRAEGDRWFPEQRTITRRRAKTESLKAEEQFYEPVMRYQSHFEPLLMAEHAEEQRAHAERQIQWAPERLKAEGYMIEDLGATLYPYHRRANTYIYTFAKTGKTAAGNQGDLAFHTFKSGTVTELCRTHPHYDYVMLNGKTRDGATRVESGGQYSGSDPSETPLLSGPIEKLLGSVYSVGKKYIRVAFPVPIQGIEQGLWRLDEGCNDVALRIQIEAVRLLHADPTETERQDASTAARQAKYSSYVSPARSDEDEAFNEPRRQSTLQTVLQGTNLRDKLLRAFQADYLPQDTSASLRIDEASPPQLIPKLSPLPLIADLKPGDVDATPLPPPHPVFEHPSILAKNELIASWTKRYRAEDGRPPVRVEGDPEVPLNASQMRAIAMMLSERLSLVQGPPGTGKTRVIIETIKLLKQHWKIPHPILVTAHTNAAVDNLLSGLRDHGVKAARLGNEQAIREDLRDWTIERLQEQHPLFSKYEDMGRTLQAMDDSLLGSKSAPAIYSDMPRSDVVARKTEMKGRRKGVKLGMTRDILLDADVICTTCLSAASWTLDAIDFPIVFLDEASMATEPLSLIPLMKGSSHVAIIGDHKQLPPIIVSETGQLGGLATSMFERLIHEHNIPSIMLDTQYRMHPQIAHFPNRSFYASALANGTAESDGSIKTGFEPPITDFLVEDDYGKRQNVTFVHHDSPEDPSSKSIRNAGEAERVCDVAVDLLLKNPTLKGTDIGIITPYRAQIRQLIEYLRNDSVRRAVVVDILGEARARELEDIEIKTVDGFEGREKAVIIFSTVRNNPGGFIGFMADWRRLNVGLTRAKRALIILGSAEHLAKSNIGQKAAELLPSGGAQVWRELMAWLSKEGLILRDD